MFARHGLQSLAAARSATPDAAEVPEPATNGARGSEVAAMRRRLLALADGEGVPAELVYALSDADLLARVGMADWPLSAFLRSLERSARMAQGFVPVGWTRAGYCPSCGPVFLPAEGVSADASEPGRCPWCQHTSEGRWFIRPTVRCVECSHYLANALNPEAGMGCCAIGKVHRNARPPFPYALRRCRFWLPQTPAGECAVDSGGDDGREDGRASGGVSGPSFGGSPAGNSDPDGRVQNRLPVQLTPGATR